MNLPDLKSLKDKLKIGGGKREALAAIVVVFMVILLLYVYLLFKPAMMKLKELAPKVSAGNIELKNALRDIDNHPALKEKKISLESKIDYYEKKLPTEKEIPKLLEKLSDMAAETDVKIIAITPVQESKGQAPQMGIYQAYTIKISAKCGFHELGRFLQILETGDRIMKVSNIEIVADTAKVTAHDVRLSVITYTLTKGR